ncbi:MAG TPA: PIN domain-containing protein [Allosphingosinicella sp.]|nr:PIN domain-containing protein [Allosphingosinicella sp.]
MDSNVLLYFASADPAKSARAEALMDAGGTINVLVLNEMASVMRRKFAYSWEQVARVLNTARRAFRVEPLLLRTHERGLRVAERYLLNVYDAVIVAAALDAGCDTLWSEDMHHGLVVEGKLTIRNPFRP